MDKEKTIISLNKEEQIELEQIILDEDEAQALRFLKEVIKKKNRQSKYSWM
ncbi:MAG: hypothetical protein AB7E08_00935 [Candidatus Omnitrophota bacterium]